MGSITGGSACVRAVRRVAQRSLNSRLLLGTAAIALLAVPAHANPAGGTVSTGSATISASSRTSTTVNQKSEDVVINWSSFNIGSGQTTQFAQPNSSAIAVNRIGSANASKILGTLDANGRVVLINGNGILFGKGAQVNVGSLIATSTDGSDSDLLSGKFTKAGNQNASVVNRGTITTASGGTVALVAPNVSNSGIVNAKLGTVSLGAANAFTVDFTGDGLVSFAAQGDVNGKATAANTGRLTGANVSMTAHAAEGLATGVVDAGGIIQAQSVRQLGGSIVLDAGEGGSIAVTNAKLEANGAAGGGTIAVGSWNDASVTVNSGSVLNASATKSGNGGNIKVVSDSTSFTGTALAEGGILGGDGGTIETSGGSLFFTGSHIDAGASAGKAGTWLLDPVNEIIDSSGAANISSALQTQDVELLTNSTLCANWGSCVSGAGDIDIESAISWNTSHTLTLDAWNSINIDASITATGAGSIVMTFNHGGGGGTLNFGAPASGTGNIAFTDVVSGNTQGSLSIQGTNYTLVNSIAQLATDIGSNASGVYALANSIDAGGTTYSDSPTGANVIFGGTFEGLGNTISNLKISNAAESAPEDIGLFSQLTGTVADIVLGNVNVAITNTGTSGIDLGALAGLTDGTVSNVAVTGSVTLIGANGGGEVGVLAGENDGMILGSHSAGSVFGDNFTVVGGLVGQNVSGSIENSFSTVAASASGQGYAGGLVGWLTGGTIEQAYATGPVTGYEAGGLIGQAVGATVENSYATGAVTGAGGVGNEAGGLVGDDEGGNIYADDYWDVATSGQASSAGTATGLTTAQMQGTFANMPGLAAPTWSTGTGMFPYLSWQFIGTPQVLSGTALNGYGTDALSAGNVTVDANGSAFVTLTTGADGSFYDLVAPGTFTTNEPLLAYTTGANNGAHVEAFSGNATGFDIWGNTLIAPTSDTTYSSATGTWLQTQDSALIAEAIGTDSNASFVTSLTNFGYVATGGNFTIDEPFSTAFGIFVETRNGNLIVAAPISEIVQGGVTLYSSNALDIDAAVNVTDGGNVSLAAGYDTTTAPGTSLLELSFGLGSNGFAGNLNYSKGSGEGISGQALTINGTQFTLLYSMADVQNIDCSLAPAACGGGAASASLSGNYALANSLDASGFGYETIGAGLFSPYTGWFEGLGHTISNLVSQDLNPPVAHGLFSGSSGTIRDIGMVGGEIGSSGYIGFLAGIDSGVIENTFETGVVDANNVDPSQASGGLVGQVTTTGVVVNSFAAGTFARNGAQSVGGLVGDLQGALVNDYATVPVNMSAGSTHGGLVGTAESGSVIKNSYATGAVSGHSDIGGLVGSNAGIIVASYAIGDVTGTTNVGGLVGQNSGTIFYGYWDTQTSGKSTGIGSDSANQSGNIFALTTAEMQGSFADMPVLTAPTWATGTGLFPYLSWQFSGTPQALTGTAFTDSGITPLGGANVSVDVNGQILPTVSSGANGYYYELAAPGSFANGDPLIAYTTGSNSGARADTFSGTTTGFDIWGSTLIAPTSDTTYSPASATSLQTQDAALISQAMGADSNAPAIASLSNYGYIATGASFTIDQTLSPSKGLFIETRNGNLTVADPITLSGANGLTLDSADALTIDAPISVTGAGAVVLDAGYDTTTVPGTSLLELSFGLGSSGFAGNLNYAAGSGEGISGQALTINGTQFTLLYSMADVQNIDCSLVSAACGGGAASASLSGNYALANSLDASGFGYETIGSGLFNPYTGWFEGLGHTISNLVSQDLNPPVAHGLFSGSSGTIRDIGMVGGEIGSSGYIGFLAGIDSGIIENTFETGVVDANNVDPTSGSGGLVGQVAPTGVVVNSFAAGTFDHNDADNVGGLVGDLQGTLVNDYSTAPVTILSGGALGGLVGTAEAGSRIENSYATGAVSGGGEIGGLVGYLDGGSVSNSFATGAVSGTSFVGGLVGESEEGPISSSYAMGAVSGSSGVGGLVGALLDPSSSVTDSFSIGRVTGSSNVGGLVGEQSDSGGVTDGYWDKETSGISTGSNGAGLTTAQMQGTFANMSGFASPAWATGTDLFPYLSWQFASAPQAIAGTVENVLGATVAGESVGLLVNGTAATPVLATTSGANGYYYDLLAPGTISAGGSNVLAYLESGTPGNTYVQNATGSIGNMLVGEGGIVLASAATDSATIFAGLSSALGSASGSQFLYNASTGFVSGAGVVIIDRASSFTIDSSIDVGDRALFLDASGSITQNSGAITASTLESYSTGGISLGSSTNSIGEIATVANVGTGGIAITDASALTVAGTISTGSASNSAITLTTTGTGNGITISGHLTGGTVDLVSTGTISETKTGYIDAGTLKGSSNGNVTLLGWNQIGALGNFMTNGTGAFDLYDFTALDVTGTVNTAKHTVKLVDEVGNLEIDGTLHGGTVTLDSIAGEVLGAGTIDADRINVTADTGIDLDGTNDIVAIGTDTTSSGTNVIDQH